MRFHEFKSLTEAPLQDIEYHASENPGAFSDRDLTVLKKYMADNTYKTKLAKVPFNFYVYVIDDAARGAFGKDYPEGEIKQEIINRESTKYEDAIEMDLPVHDVIFAAIKERQEQDRSSIHFVLGDNYSESNQIAPTPWILVHRWCHAAAQTTSPISRELQNRQYLRDIAMAFRDHRSQSIYRALDYIEELFMKCLTMKSALTDKIIEQERDVEISTQYLITGDIKLSKQQLFAFNQKATETWQLPDDVLDKMFEEFLEIVENFKVYTNNWVEKAKGKAFYI